jgi:hypothetical protein
VWFVSRFHDVLLLAGSAYQSLHSQIAEGDENDACRSTREVASVSIPEREREREVREFMKTMTRQLGALICG